MELEIEGSELVRSHGSLARARSFDRWSDFIEMKFTHSGAGGKIKSSPVAGRCEVISPVQIAFVARSSGGSIRADNSRYFKLDYPRDCAKCG